MDHGPLDIPAAAFERAEQQFGDRGQLIFFRVVCESERSLQLINRQGEIDVANNKARLDDAGNLPW